MIRVEIDVSLRVAGVEHVLGEFTWPCPSLRVREYGEKNLMYPRSAGHGPVSTGD